MLPTIRLYDEDSHLYSFGAEIISCEKSENAYMVILDRTAFFPEGGGQPADTGYIGNARVSDVQIKDGIITHYTDIPLTVGEKAECTLDSEKRFRRMQNHSGEHIVSGLIHKMFGFNNVGFHMGSEDVTIDIDGVLTRQDLDRIESEANRIVYENVSVRAEYPDSDTLQGLEYRSKLELTENVRIVTVEGCDVCACCAPHVNRTGEIGIIKLLDFISYKGGVRIHMLCGRDALEDYHKRYLSIAEISAGLSAKQSQVTEAVERVKNELAAEKQAAVQLKKQIIELKIALLKSCEGNMVIFEADMDMLNLRLLVNRAVEMCTGVCAAFSGDDEKGYNYIIAGKNIPLRERSKEINSALNGRGGGKDDMIQGSVKASAQDIRRYFQDFS